jgi:hypothetical protein
MALQNILRSEYQLDDAANYPAGQHPLLLLFMSFKNVRPTASLKSPKLMALGPSYSSLYILVPYAHLLGQSATAPLSVMPKGLMNNRFMVFASRTFNGLPKEFAHIKWSGSSFTAGHKINSLIEANFIAAPQVHSTDVDTNIVRSLIDMPTLSDSPADSGKFGTSRASIDWARALITPVSASVTINETLLKGLNVKNQFIPSAKDSPWGAFRFKSAFRIGKFTPLKP